MPIPTKALTAPRNVADSLSVAVAQRGTQVAAGGGPSIRFLRLSPMLISTGVKAIRMTVAAMNTANEPASGAQAEPCKICGRSADVRRIRQEATSRPPTPER